MRFQIVDDKKKVVFDNETTKADAINRAKAFKKEHGKEYIVLRTDEIFSTIEADLDIVF